MFQIDRNQKINVEAMKSKLLRGKTTRQRFKLPMTEEQATDLLIAAYMAEVEYRRRKYESNAETENNISRLARILTSDNAKFGIMFCGVCGNGKTTLLYALQTAILEIDKYGGFEDKGTGISIVDAKEVAQYARDYKSFRELRNRPMLAIEDIGREPTEMLDYGNVLNPIIDLIEYRYNNQLFTAITTNLTSEQISTKYGRRIADRFNEMLEVIIFKNPSYRK